MNMKWKIFRALAVVLINPCFALGQPKTDLEMTRPISEPRAAHDMTQFSWPYQVRTVCEYLGVPCGIEESPHSLIPGPDQRFRPTAVLDWRAVSPRQTLEFIVGQHPDYEWRFDRGVLNVVPRKGHEYRSWWRPRLSRRIVRADYESVSSSEVMVDLCVRAGVIERPFPTGDVSVISPVPKTRKITIHLRNMTVREALNAVAAEDGKIIWKFIGDPLTNEFKLKIDSWDYSVAGGFSEPW